MTNTTPISISLDVSPLDFARFMFQNTAENGTLVLSDWYDSEKDDALSCRNYSCNMHWTQKDLDDLIQEYDSLMEDIGVIAPLLEQLDQQYQAELYMDSSINKEMLTNEQLEGTYQCYIAPFSARWSLSQQAICRVGEGPCAFELIFHARRLCQLVHLHAPKPVCENEARMLIAAMAIHNYGELNMKEVLKNFISFDLGRKIEAGFIYNEFSLQHELGIYLRERLDASYSVKFERHIADVLEVENKADIETVKREIDIVIQREGSDERYGIELKFPRNGQYPVQMFSFIKDIRFCEQMLEHNFTKTFCLTVVDDAKFYSNRYKKKTDATDIYRHFRNDGDEGKEPIKGEYSRKTAKTTIKFTMNGRYFIQWERINNTNPEHYYYFIEAQKTR